jgi:hypothetical protein
MHRLLHQFPSCFRSGVVLVALFCVLPSASAATPTGPRELVRADRATLDALYASGSVGDMPTGFLPGRVIVDPGSRGTAAKSRRLSLLWQGKVFHGDGTAHNRVLGVTAVPMKVYQGESWHDGGPAIIVDYADSWRMFRNVRDEIREVSPGVYLGRTYVTKKTGTEQATYFALQAPRGRR